MGELAFHQRITIEKPSILLYNQRDAFLMRLNIITTYIAINLDG